MNTSLSEALVLVRQLKDKLEGVQGVEKVLCPPFISLALLREVLQGSTIGLGAQNMFFQEKGAYTGEVSPLMLQDLCTYVILGHSERRQYFAEDDGMINQKVRSALKWRLNPILCVGERLAEKEQGQAEAVITRQVRAGLSGLDSPEGLVVAYEPVWAIGTGKAATGEEANKTIGLIRRLLAELFGTPKAEAVRIQYGGSVNGKNIAEFISQPHIDGALVGGASLNAEEFLSIVEQTAAIKGR